LLVKFLYFCSDLPVTMSTNLSFTEVLKKLEYYCSYQDRCHNEVMQKAKELKLSSIEIDEAVVYLIAENYLNEERFARSFARGKFNIKKWGKVRITQELKSRAISPALIKLALTEIDQSVYYETFHNLATQHWNSLTERNGQKKRKKFSDYLLRKGYESDLIFEKLKELETTL
jgi:regulatory protein